MQIDKKKPVVSGRASIITTSITIRVFWKNQLDKAIKWLIQNDYEFSWSVEDPSAGDPTAYVLEVNSISWASNLKRLVKILEKSDFRD